MRSNFKTEFLEKSQMEFHDEFKKKLGDYRLAQEFQ